MVVKIKYGSQISDLNNDTFKTNIYDIEFNYFIKYITRYVYGRDRKREFAGNVEFVRMHRCENKMFDRESQVLMYISVWGVYPILRFLYQVGCANSDFTAPDA